MTLLREVVGYYCGDLCDISAGSRVTLLHEVVGHYCRKVWDIIRGMYEPFLLGGVGHCCRENRCQIVGTLCWVYCRGRPAVQEWPKL